MELTRSSKLKSDDHRRLILAQSRRPETTLYEWLNHATAKKLVRRSGQGTRMNPWRYRLPNADDAYYARGELPPLRLEFD